MSLEELWELFPIELKEYNPNYLNWYLEEANNIKKSITSCSIKGIHHIGSTAIPELISKPIIDILLEVDEDCNVKKLQENLEKQQWILMSKQEEPYWTMVFNKGYTEEGFAEKIFHLHVRHLGDWPELYFRDYLWKHEEIANEYGKLKLSLLEEFRNDRDGYTEAKADFILEHTAKAREEFGNKYGKKE